MVWIALCKYRQESAHVSIQDLAYIHKCPPFTDRGSVPNVEYAPKLEYLDILVKMVHFSELVDVRGEDRQMLSTCNRMNVCEECSLFYIYIYISWNSDFL